MNRLGLLCRVSLLGASLVLGGCEHEDACDDDAEASRGLCREPVADSGMDSGIDASNDEDSSTATETLGEPCQTDSECGQDAPFCAKSPFDTVGYCTLRDCSTDNDTCPSGYSCLDLGIASVPAFCSKS